jgi:caffeoyl-CoA O-methyltransferase
MKGSADAILRPEQASYLASLERPRDALLAKMEKLAADRDFSISDPEVASFLGVTARARAPRLVVELGTNIGYGAIVLARAAGPAAKVLTIEYSEELCTMARDFIREAGLEGRIEVILGEAIPELEKMRGPIDLAYVDCVKEEYVRYLELLIPRMAERGVIVADNVLWRGDVARAEAGDAQGDHVRARALGAFNHAITSHPELRAVILPLGDGVAYAIKT